MSSILEGLLTEPNGKLGFVIKCGDKYVKELDYNGLTDDLQQALMITDWKKHKHSYDCAMVHRKIPREHEIHGAVSIGNKITLVEVIPISE